MHEVLVNRLGGLSLPRKSVVRLTDRPNIVVNKDRSDSRARTVSQTNGRVTQCVKHWLADLAVLGLGPTRDGNQLK